MSVEKVSISKIIPEIKKRLPRINKRKIVGGAAVAGLTLAAVGLAIYVQTDHSKNITSPTPISQPFDAKSIPLPPLPIPTGESPLLPAPIPTSATPPADIEQDMTNQGWHYSFSYTDSQGLISLFYERGKEFKVRLVTPTPTTKTP